MLSIQVVTDPVYLTLDRQYIRLTVKFAEFPEAVEFVATPNDPEAHGRFLYEEAVKGVYGPVHPYTAPPEGATNGNQPDTP